VQKYAFSISINQIGIKKAIEFFSCESAKFLSIGVVIEKSRNAKIFDWNEISISFF